MLTDRVQLQPYIRSRGLAAALGAAIRDGRLAPGERMPTQRELAFQLKIAVATVGRAYAELERQGLISPHVGRGTFVAGDAGPRGPAPAFLARNRLEPSAVGRPDTIDMAAYRVPVPPQATEVLEEVFAAWGRSDGAWLLGASPAAGLPWHRAALAEWVKTQGVDVPPEHVTITMGGQHATLAALLTLSNQSDLVATEELTDPRMKAVASYLDRKLVAIPCDEGGMLPEALEAVCRERRIALICCAPRLQNPLNTILSLERRVAVADIARRYGLQIVENDIYGTILDDPLPPIQALAPERTHYLTSLGRIGGPGLKVGCLVSPADQIGRTQAGVGASTGTATSIAVELAAALIESGALTAMKAWQREENARRVALLADHPHLAKARSHPASPHLWLPLTDHWRAEDFVDAAGRRDIAIAPTHGFMADRRSIPHAVRLCIGAPGDLDTLATAYDRLERLMAGAPRSSVEAA